MNPRDQDWQLAAMAFAEEQLGPASTALLATGPALADVVERHAQGRSVEDAVLGVVHARGAHDTALSAEFMGHVFDRLMNVARPSLSPGMRRLVETGDLLDSVAADLWADLHEVQFETMSAFVALCLRRVRWKTTDTARGFGRAKRREDLRVDLDPTELAGADELTPPRQLADQEDRARLMKILDLLSERDGMVLRALLDGAPLERVMGELDLSRASARKAVQRALARARDVAGNDSGRER